jgi:hypothetical protein
MSSGSRASISAFGSSVGSKPWLGAVDLADPTELRSAHGTDFDHTKRSYPLGSHTKIGISRVVRLR